ncbi:glycogen debranching N-terminal domain-containing protein [Sanguibacter sp. Leaf3]|uniref:glycogen debranching N-terminal domain-containing protein n=1 Tax=Sanguibacter sp. Leaf3 TaxID=1736209 RepID=UPI0006F89064|nr:glycogen debranching N-terminal domain-containing protein [Sanguibacter sp. Leaf3]KQT98349.1 amylo-alpha-1,6-glucosidase [Sanguibacter sp. Leaf3]
MTDLSSHPPASSTTPSTVFQPLLSAETVVLHAPVQAWSDHAGAMGSSPIHGVWTGDTRVLRSHTLRVDGTSVEHIATAAPDASTVRFEYLLRGLDDHGADPDVRLSLLREVSTTGTQETLTITSRLERPLDLRLTLTLTPDASSMEVVKAGLPATAPERTSAGGDAATWSGGGASTTLTAHDGRVDLSGSDLSVSLPLHVPARASASTSWSITTALAGAVVSGVTTPQTWKPLGEAPADDRLARWLDRALDDLSALRMTTTEHPEDVFFAAGAPWFFTLFGRDSLWAARFVLPLDISVAAGTLRALARLQGTSKVAASAEQPGKIMHELRQHPLEIHGEGVTLSPLYYGTVDATALWVCVLHDAWKAGLPDHEVAALLPHLERALAWLRDYGDSDGDGLLEYVDETGHGLSNQGWKDSGDSVQWVDGTLAEGPIALCEVQAYAYEAAVHGADLLDAFDRPGGGEWRRWAEQLQRVFRDTFWTTDDAGPYPAIALDASKKAVTTVTSNIGHLLGTGLLSHDEEALVAARLVSPELSSGFGLRTLSTTAAGYWPLGYHLGTVWTHDTAVAITGLARSGFAREAQHLADGLLAAAPSFDYRMPELHGGDPAHESTAPVPYPASCRPQAWAAAAAVAVWAATEGVAVERSW